MDNEDNIIREYNEYSHEKDNYIASINNEPNSNFSDVNNTSLTNPESLIRVGFYNIMDDFKEIYNIFLPYIQTACILPNIYLRGRFGLMEQNINNQNENHNQNNYPQKLTIFNECTKETIILNDIDFNPRTENVYVFKNGEYPKECTLESLVGAVVNKLNWDTKTHVIIATIGQYSFSYGVQYFCVKNIVDDNVDICISEQPGKYVSISKSDIEPQYYMLDEIIAISN